MRKKEMKINWQTKKLGEVCYLIKGKKPKIFALKSNKPYLTARVVRNTEEPKFAAENCPLSVWVKKEDIVIIMDGSNSGEMFTGLEGAIASTMGIIKYPKDLLTPKYLLHFLITHRENFTKLRTGAAIPHLNKEQFENLEITLPPLSEQRRIVKILDEVFEKTAKAKENAKKNLQNAKELFESYLQSVFAKSGKDWEEKKLEEVCEYDKIPHKKTNLPYVGLEDIESNSGRFLGSLNPRKVKSNTFHFTNEHVLYGRLRPYLNKVLLPNFEGHCSTEIFPIKPNGNLDRGFLFNWLISEKTVKQINATWTGARMPRANMNIVLDFKIPIPPLPEQKSIVAKLDALSAETKKLEAIYKKKLADLEELKKSILKKAFAGKL